MASSRPILWDIYEEHLDEAAFLWGLWELALDAANYALDDVIDGPEERLLAHLDGLVLGGARVAEKLLVPALSDEDAGKISAATWALLQAEDADHVNLVFEALTKTDKKEVRAAIGRAFELSHRADLPARLLPRLEASAPAVQTVIAEVVSRNAGARTGGAGQGESGASTGDGVLPLERLLATRNPELLAAALRASRRAPKPDHMRFVEAALGSPYVATREAAIESGMVLGMRAAWQACNKIAARNASGSRLPLALMALGGEAVDLNAVIKKLGVKALQRDAVWALGFSGTIEAADAVLAVIDDEGLAKLAGESFATITGAPIFGALTKVGETDNTSPPELEDDDAPLPELKPEDGLPMPNGARVRAWWEKVKAKGALQPGVRYLFGHPVTAEGLRHAIEVGPMWRRRVWCLEVAMRSGFDVEVTAWARQQKEAASAFPSGLRVDRGLMGIVKA